MVNIAKITPNLHYYGKILKQGNKHYTGAFFKMLKSGKNICLDYKDGLLRKSVLSDGELLTKSYDYDKNKRLINVSKNGENIFVKDIEYELGEDFRRTEIINGEIEKTYNEKEQLVSSQILPKAIISVFFRYYSTRQKADVVLENRYFIPNLVRHDGGYALKEDGQYPIMPQLVLFKTIFKNLKDKCFLITEKKDNKELTCYKDANGKILGQSTSVLDKNDQPVWQNIKTDNGSSLDLKYFSPEEGKNNRIICISNSKKTKSALDWEFDAHGNVVRERKIERSSNGDIKQISIFERKFDKNNLMIEEKKYKETDSGKVLLYTAKKEYNSRKLPVKVEYYNGKDELESSEYAIYDKRGKLRVLKTREYGEYPESGYVIYDKNGIIRKKSTFDELEGSIIDEHYDKNSLFVKKIIKNEDGVILYKYEFLYDADKKTRIKTIKKDRNNNIELTIDYLKGKDNKTIKVYKDPNGKLIGKEFIKHDENGYKHYYTNSEGKRCNFVEILIAVHGDMNI